MPKSKKSGKMKFQKQYEKIMKNTVPNYSSQNQQWATTGDVFEKFTLLKNYPTSTSSNTIVIEQPKKQHA
jgi:hypothetical protein